VSAGRPRARRAALLALCGLAIALATGCGASMSAGDSAAASSVSAPAPVDAPGVSISGFAFQVPTSVSPGATVSVLNMDGEAHTVTADEGGAFDVQVPGGATGTFPAPMTPGSYAFHCSYHGDMHGVLVVR